MLERLIKNDLYFTERKRKRRSQKASVDESSPASPAKQSGQPRGEKRSAAELHRPDESEVRRDHYEGALTKPITTQPPEGHGWQAEVKKDHYRELFGQSNTNNLPESGAWWRANQTKLMAIPADHQYGLMTSVVNSTHNDCSPELLAHSHRGPLAKPPESEMYEYLLTRKEPRAKRAKIQD